MTIACCWKKLSSRVSVLFTVMLLLVACSGGSTPFMDEVIGPGAQIELELNHLNPPATVDGDIFADLKAALAAELRDRGITAVDHALPEPVCCAVTTFGVWRAEDGTALARWTYNNAGDYDQNGEVNISDLTTLGMNFGLSEDHYHWALAKIADGDKNGEINIADVTPIGQHIGSTVDSYVVQVSPTGEAGGTWETVADVLLSEGITSSMGGVRRFQIELAEAALGDYYRVLPVFQTVVGIASVPWEYSGAALPTYNVSGTCLGTSGEPLPNVVLALDEITPQLSREDGTFVIPDVPEDYLGCVQALAAGLVFEPAERAIHVSGADITGLKFVATLPPGVVAIKHDLPLDVLVGAELLLTLEGVDHANNIVTTFDAFPTLLSSAADMQLLIPPRFEDGRGQVACSFPTAGKYSLTLTGLGEGIDGELGEIIVREPYEAAAKIAKWQGGAEAAISLTFDDGTLDHWNRGLPLWAEYNFKVTLGITSWLFDANPDRIPQLQTALDAGHELANHTADHLDLSTLTAAEIRQQLQKTEDLLYSNVTGLDHIYTVIFPYEMYDKEVLDIIIERGYLFARSGAQGIFDYAELNNAWEPPNLHLYSWANQAELPMEYWDSTTDWAVSHGDWLIEQCHGIGTLGEDGVGWSPRPESEYRAHYDHIASYGDRIWVAPISEVGRYITERNATHVSLEAVTAESLVVNLTDTLGRSIYNVPLTLEVSLPEGWGNARAHQSLNPLPAQRVLPEDVGPVLMRFELLPGAGDVTVDLI